MRSKIILTHSVAPTPHDVCWSIDASVYVAFAEDPQHPVLVGRLADTSLRGFRRVQVRVPHPYEVPVTVHAPVSTEKRSSRTERRRVVAASRHILFA